ncbi:MAG: hypothetical protein E7023_07475 [Campylobacter sp.]|nr:hypothetical protein [Campylobacter sp.]
MLQNFIKFGILTHNSLIFSYIY